MALVFDDGPVAADSGPLLEVLRRENVPATFSLVGSRVALDPSAALAMVLAGHEVANHSQTHAHSADLDDAALDREVSQAQGAITAATGSAPRWYWPPYLEMNDRLRACVARAGLEPFPARHVVASRDYDLSVGAEAIRRNATTGVEDGSIILFHEWRRESRTQLPGIISDLRRLPCTFLTLSGCHAALEASP